MSLLDRIDTAGDRGREFLSGLTPRDQALTGVMVLVVLGLLTFFVLSAMSSSRDKARTAIADAAKAQAQINMLLADFADVDEEVRALDAKLASGESISPLTWFDGLGKELGINEKVNINEKGSTETDYYRTSTVDVRIDDVALDTIVKIAHKIESSEAAMRIDEFRVKPDRKDRSKLDLRMTVSILKPLGAAG